jgi:hypothetical protein
LLGLESSMANPDLAAPTAAILPNRRFSCAFAGRQAQLQPVAEIVPNTQPTRSPSAARCLVGTPWRGQAATHFVRRQQDESLQIATRLHTLTF